MSEQKPRLPRSVVVLNIIMIVIVVALCILVVRLVNFGIGYDPLATTGESVSQSASSGDSSDPADTTTAATTTTEKSTPEMTKQSTDPVESAPLDDDAFVDDNGSETEETSSSSGETPSHASYSRDFFSADLFIGDSIGTGLHLYNKLDMKNVAASVGYTPYKAYTEACDLYDGTSATALEYAKKMQPKRIYIMLGSNGLLAPGSMEDSYNTLIEKLKTACPSSELYCISVTPVSKYTTYTITNDMVTQFNDFIKATCKDKNISYIDFHSQLIGSDGYAKDELVADDGLHFNGSTYDIMLGYIQSTIS